MNNLFLNVDGVDSGENQDRRKMTLKETQRSNGKR